MNNDFTRKYRLTIDVLSPLHIGDGQRLKLDDDYIIGNKTFKRLESERMVEHAYEIGSVSVEQILELTTRDILETLPANELEEFYRYQIPVLVSDEITSADDTKSDKIRRVYSQLKDFHERVYLPGSSVKGYLRTLLLWDFFDQNGLNLATRDYKNNKIRHIAWWHGSSDSKPKQPKTLGDDAHTETQSMNDSVFGSGPMGDQMRAVRVADSDFLSPDVMQLVAIDVTSDHTTYREVIAPGISFNVDITVNTFGFARGSHAQNLLGWDDQFLETIKHLPKIGNRHAQARLTTENSYWSGREISPQMARFNADLQQRADSGQWIGQLGWGTGWESKTLGNLIREQGDQTFADIIERYKLFRKKDKKTNRWLRYRVGQTFPATRNLIVQDGEAQCTPGWVQLKWVEL